VRLGLGLAQIGPFATPEAVRRVAIFAESTGFDSLWVMERLLRPVAPREEYPGSPDLTWPASFATCLDPLETLTFAAAHTTTVGLGTSVLNVPWYRPVLLARRLATLDVLSAGRLRLGVGLGWSEDEFAALGLPKAGLGDRLDDHLDALDALWSPDPVRYLGDGYDVAPSAAGPKPVQRPRPPLYLGAFTDRGLRRVARRADGWLTVFVPPEVIAGMWQRIRQLADGAGRDADALRLVVRANPYITPSRTRHDRLPFVGTAGDVAAEIASYAELGVHELHVDLQFSPGITTVEHLLDVAADLHARVRERVGQTTEEHV
jgi:probable F420-dependent oxidoreductase